MDLFSHVFYIFFSYLITEILILEFLCVEIGNFGTGEGRGAGGCSLMKLRIIKYIYVLKLHLQNNFTGRIVEGSRWNGLISLFFFLGKNFLHFLMLNLHSFLTLF